MYGIINKILGVLLCFLMILAMIANVIVSDQVQARRSIVAEVTNFVDEVTDTGVLDDARLSDLYLGCSAYGPVVDVQVTRYVRIVNPDGVGSVYITYVASEELSTWNKGDLVKVSVQEVGPSGLSGFLYRVFNMSIAPVDFTLSGRVRI